MTKKFNVKIRYTPEGRVAPVYTSHYIFNNWRYIEKTIHTEQDDMITITTKRVSFETVREANDYIWTISRLNDVKVAIESLNPQLLKEITHTKNIDGFYFPPKQ